MCSLSSPHPRTLAIFNTKILLKNHIKDEKQRVQR